MGESGSSGKLQVNRNRTQFQENVLSKTEKRLSPRGGNVCAVSPCSDRCRSEAPRVPPASFRCAACSARRRESRRCPLPDASPTARSRRDPNKAAPHVARCQAHINPDACRQMNHARRADTIRCRRPASASFLTRRRSPVVKISSRGAAQSGPGFVSIRAKFTACGNSRLSRRRQGWNEGLQRAAGLRREARGAFSFYGGFGASDF